MCFSARISFTSSAVLLVVAIVGTYFALRGNKRFILLNMTAYFYAFQQFSEGMIWIHSPLLNARCWATLFLFFAFFVYPWFAAVSCYFITRQLKLRKRIFWVGCAGFIFGVWAFSNVLLTPDLSLAQCRAHIFYRINLMGEYPIDGSFMNYVLIPIYVFLTSAPFFITDRRYFSLIGCVIAISAVICWFVYLHYFISVWCFYAAITAGCIIVVSYLQYRIKYRKLVATIQHF